MSAAPSVEVAACLGRAHRGVLGGDDPTLGGARGLLRGQADALRREGEALWRAHGTLREQLRRAHGAGARSIANGDAAVSNKRPGPSSSSRKVSNSVLLSPSGKGSGRAAEHLAVALRGADDVLARKQVLETATEEEQQDLLMDECEQLHSAAMVCERLWTRAWAVSRECSEGDSESSSCSPVSPARSAVQHAQCEARQRLADLLGEH